MEALGAVLAVVFWLVACWLALAFITMPLTLLAFAAGLLYGAILVVTGYLRIYRGAEDTRVLARPDPHAPRRARAPCPCWDGGWPGYLSWQVERDVVAAAAWPRRRVRQLLVEVGKQAASQARILIVLFPAVPVLFGCLAGVTAGACAMWAVLAVAVECATSVPRLARLCAIWALRAVDASVRWWRGAAVTCPGCRYVAWLPAYPCAQGRCRVVHRDLRPGRLGVWRRRCQCGTHLPTTILRAGRELTPTCPNCGDPLRAGAGAVSEARIVLSGGPGVGKTQLLARAATEASARAPASWEPADEFTATWLGARQAPADGHQEDGYQEDGHHEDGQSPAKETGLLTFCHAARGRQQYFHIADLEGRLFETAGNLPGLWQLGTTRRHLLVLDATVLPSVRDQIGSAGRGSGGSRAGYAWSETSLANAELPYRLLVEQLSRVGARTSRCSLALVITKADYLIAHGLGPVRNPEGIPASGLRDWLRTIELDTLIEVAEHDFARVRCFLVGDGREGSAAPFEWLLSQYPRGAATP